MSNPAYQQVAKVIVDKAGNLSETERKALKGLLDGFDGQPQLPFPSYHVIVDYDLTVEQLIRSGRYLWFNHDVSSRHFPSNEKGVTGMLIYLVNFNRDISSSENAIKELDKMNPPLRPATLKELLALAIVQPDLQRNNFIAALGSNWCDLAGHVNIPYLHGSVSRRCLDLFWERDTWYQDCRFAAIRK